MNKKRKIALGVTATIVLLSVVFLVYALAKPKAPIPKESTETTTQNDKQMAPDFNLKDLNGKNVKLSDYRGKIIILNFWAVWCKYCKQEMPDLNELNKSLIKENKVVILAVDSGEGLSTIKPYLKENKISMNVLLDSNETVTTQYGITGFPTTFVINKDGSLFTYIPGATNKETLETIISKMN